MLSKMLPRPSARAAPADVGVTPAREVRSTYCSMVYGKQLTADLGSKEMVPVVQRDFRSAGLPPRDVAMLIYAEKVARDASQVTPADVDALRTAGFTDANISEIALCTAFRCFIGRFFDAVGRDRRQPSSMTIRPGAPRWRWVSRPEDSRSRPDLRPGRREIEMTVRPGYWRPDRSARLSC
ncbi:hypothetical protein [Ferrovibrio sp.]|uniref:carboxymuconolactone decarboxylase family protein n=1 Tax=Ferrovibrio sp. TaxID=1917215 RepID=UPI0025BA766C|nr:hypothetical protein [Ferrovibrio sp.]